MLPFFFCVSGGGVVQIRASTRAPSEGGGHDFCHSNSDSRKLDGGLPGIWGSLTSDLPREDAGGSSSGTSWYRAGLLRALEARPLPASIAPDAVHHPDSNNDWQTTAQWFEMSGTLVDFFLPARGFRHRREVLAGSLGPPEGERSTGARNRNLQRRARLAPSLDRPAGSNCRAPDSSGYIGERRSRRQSEFSYFKNERTRAVSHLYGPASMLSPSLFARTRTILNKSVLHLYADYVVNILRANMR